MKNEWSYAFTRWQADQTEVHRFSLFELQVAHGILVAACENVETRGRNDLLHGEWSHHNRSEHRGLGLSRNWT